MKITFKRNGQLGKFKMPLIIVRKTHWKTLSIQGNHQELILLVNFIEKQKLREVGLVAFGMACYGTFMNIYGMKE